MASCVKPPRSPNAQSNPLTFAAADLFPSYTTSITTPLPTAITRSLAVSGLHDHSLIIGLNPLVVSHHLVDVPSQSTTVSTPTSTSPAPTYSITDRLPVLWWSASMTCSTSFENTESGVRTKVHAPMGVEVAGEWEVLDRLPHQSSSNNEEEITESGLMLRETVTVRCNLFVMSYVRATLGKSHKEMHERFVARLLDGEEGHGEGG